MSAQEVLVVITNVPDRATAERIAETLVTGCVAACVNILAECTSVYRWQGKLEHANEVPLLIKTTRAAYPQLEIELRKLHPYELPEIIALPVSAGLPEYLNWVVTETRIEKIDASFAVDRFAVYRASGACRLPFLRQQEANFPASEQAFGLSIEVCDKNALLANFKVTPGYYCIATSSFFRSLATKPRLPVLSFPKATPRTTPILARSRYTTSRFRPRSCWSMLTRHDR